MTTAAYLVMQEAKSLSHLAYSASKGVYERLNHRLRYRQWDIGSDSFIGLYHHCALSSRRYGIAAIAPFLSTVFDAASVANSNACL